MTEGAGPVSQAIQGRRSVRSFGDQAVQPRIVEALLKDACAAPAPHHSRPWRFVHLASRESRERLADAMSDAWRADLEAEGRSVHEVAKLLKRSQAQILEAPLLILTCLHLSGARHWPDEQRRRSERDMFVQSLGAALQNILLAAGERGLAGYLKGAPLFCRPAVAEALALPDGWEPEFLVLLGYPGPGFKPSERPPIDVLDFLIER